MKVYPFHTANGGWSICIDCGLGEHATVEKIWNMLNNDFSFLWERGELGRNCNFFSFRCQDAYACQEMLEDIIKDRVRPLLLGINAPKIAVVIHKPRSGSVFERIQQEIEIQNKELSKEPPTEWAQVAILSACLGSISKKMLTGSKKSEYTQELVSLAASCCRWIEE